MGLLALINVYTHRILRSVPGQEVHMRPAPQPCFSDSLCFSEVCVCVCCLGLDEVCCVVFAHSLTRSTKVPYPQWSMPQVDYLGQLRSMRNTFKR